MDSIGELLVARGKLRPAELERARRLGDNDGRDLGPLLVRLGLVSERDLLAAYAAAYELEALDEGCFPEAPPADCNLSGRFLKEHLVAPLAADDAAVTVAVASPENTYAVQAIEIATGRNVIVKLAALSQVESAIERLYGEGRASMEGLADEIEAEDAADGADSIERLRDLAAEAPIIRLVSLIIRRAVEQRASDIHIEPFESSLTIRYRIDGVLQEAEAPPPRSAAAVVSRVKLMAKLNIAERRLPQDGRMQLRSQGRLIDLRVSTVPTMHGESLALRILDQERVELKLKTLGFESATAERFLDVLRRPHGIILVTGPTGSGKTTTLYAALQTLNTPEKKLLTVEDPVEYQLDGINQIQVKPQIGLNFADALRAIVRQDPDVIMVGEMRDVETARIAVQSALTGHLVLSTLHTNDAGGSITRLLDMGIEDYLLTSTVNGIFAQRLVRKLCLECREPYRPTAALAVELDLGNDRRDAALHRARGCEQCAGTGYLGRTIIAEFLPMSEPIQRLVLGRADSAQIQEAALGEGMISMRKNGLDKALQGITTIEEVSRVTHD